MNYQAAMFHTKSSTSKATASSSDPASSSTNRLPAASAAYGSTKATIQTTTSNNPSRNGAVEEVDKPTKQAKSGMAEGDTDAKTRAPAAMGDIKPVQSFGRDFCENPNNAKHSETDTISTDAMNRSETASSRTSTRTMNHHRLDDDPKQISSKSTCADADVQQTSSNNESSDWQTSGAVGEGGAGRQSSDVDRRMSFLRPRSAATGRETDVRQRRAMSLEPVTMSHDAYPRHRTTILNDGRDSGAARQRQRLPVGNEVEARHLPTRNREAEINWRPTPNSEADTRQRSTLSQDGGTRQRSAVGQEADRRPATGQETDTRGSQETGTIRRWPATSDGEDVRRRFAVEPNIRERPSALTNEVDPRRRPANTQDDTALRHTPSTGGEFTPTTMPVRRRSVSISMNLAPVVGNMRAVSLSPTMNQMTPANVDSRQPTNITGLRMSLNWTPENKAQKHESSNGSRPTAGGGRSVDGGRNVKTTDDGLRPKKNGDPSQFGGRQDRSREDVDNSSDRECQQFYNQPSEVSTRSKST